MYLQHKNPSCTRKKGSFYIQHYNSLVKNKKLQDRRAELKNSKLKNSKLTTQKLTTQNSKTLFAFIRISGRYSKCIVS